MCTSFVPQKIPVHLLFPYPHQLDCHKNPHYQITRERPLPRPENQREAKEKLEKNEDHNCLDGNNDNCLGDDYSNCLN